MFDDGFCDPAPEAVHIAQNNTNTTMMVMVFSCPRRLINSKYKRLWYYQLHQVVDTDTK